MVLSSILKNEDHGVFKINVDDVEDAKGISKTFRIVEVIIVELRAHHLFVLLLRFLLHYFEIVKIFSNLKLVN